MFCPEIFKLSIAFLYIFLLVIWEPPKWCRKTGNFSMQKFESHGHTIISTTGIFEFDKNIIIILTFLFGPSIFTN